MSPALYRLGRLAARRPWTVIGAWLIVAVVVMASSAAFGRDLDELSEVPGTDSQRAGALLTAAGSERAGVTAQIVMTPLDDRATLASAGLRDALDDVEAGAAALPHVLATRREVSPDGRVAVIRLQYPVVGELSPDDLQALKALVGGAREGSPLQIEMGGDLFFAFEEGGAGAGELIGLIAAVLILLVAFGSLIAMGLPIAMALFGLALGISSMALVTHLIAIPIWVPGLATMIGLGVGIDYALLLVTRHREHLADGTAVVEAAGRAVATAGKAVIFAGGTVVLSILGLAVAGIPFLTAAGIAVSLVVLVMVVASVTLLPALLGLAGHRIDRFAVRRADHGASGPGWTRWGRHVTAHARAYAVGATVLLLALSAPVLDLRLGYPDEGNLPRASTERRAYDLVAHAFGPGTNGPLVIAVADPGAAGAVRAAVMADRGIASVGPPETNAAAGVATLVAYPTTAPQDDATAATIDRLRERVLPPGAHVGGHTATWADVGDRVAERLPLFLAAVVLLSVLLLTVLFRSVLVPLKAAVMNLLGVGAAYGIVVAVFDWGWGGDLIGLESTVPIVPFIPLFMFAILFGLSMDYEVFLLSRIRENYLRTRDNDASVIAGIAGTGRVITSAALIMIAVFGGFVLADDPRLKMFGLGLATAIFVDATIIRLVLVPATMKLLGDANWWFPRFRTTATRSASAQPRSARAGSRSR